MPPSPNLPLSYPEAAERPPHGGLTFLFDLVVYAGACWSLLSLNGQIDLTEFCRLLDKQRTKVGPQTEWICSE